MLSFHEAQREPKPENHGFGPFDQRFIVAVEHTPDYPSFGWRDQHNTPWNKRHGEVESWAELVVQDYDGKGHNPKPWISLRATEWTKGPSGRVTEKVISLTLNPEARKALLAYLLKTEGEGA